MEKLKRYRTNEELIVPRDDALVNDVFGSRLDDLLHEAKRKEAIAMMCYLDNETHARGW